MPLPRGAQVSRCLSLLAVALLSGCAANQASLSTHAAIPAPMETAGAGEVTSPEPVGPPPGKMSLAQVAAHTIATNPDIGISKAQLKDAQASMGIMLAPMLPSVDYSLAQGRETTYAYDTHIGTDATRREASIQASQLLFDFGKSLADIEWARNLKDSASFRVDAKTQDVLLSTAEAYLAVLELDRQIANSQANVAAHQQMYKIVSQNQQGGNGTAADVEKASTRLQAAKAETLDLQAQRRTAASAFEQVTGWAPGTLQIPKPPATRPSTSPDAIAQYAANDPQLLAFEKDKVSLQAQATSLGLDYLPKLTLNVSAKIQENVMGVNPATTNQRAMLSLGGPLFDGGDRVAKIQQVQARIEETDFRYQRALDALKYDLGDADRVLETASAKLSNIAGRIASGEQVVTLYTQQFQAGTRTIFELLDAQQELSAAKSEQITAQFDVLRAKYHMLKLTGELTGALLQ